MVHDVTASPFVCPDTASLDSRRCKSTTSSLFCLFQTPRSLCVCVCVCTFIFIFSWSYAGLDGFFLHDTGDTGDARRSDDPAWKDAQTPPPATSIPGSRLGPFLHLLPCPWPGIQTLHLQQDPTSVDLQRATHQRPALVVIDHSRRYRQLTRILRLLYPLPRSRLSNFETNPS